MTTCKHESIDVAHVVLRHRGIEPDGSRALVVTFKCVDCDARARAGIDVERSRELLRLLDLLEQEESFAGQLEWDGA